MRVEPVLTLSKEINTLRERTANIVNEKIVPNELELYQRTDNTDSLREEIKEAVKAAGLWAPHLPQSYGGMGLTFLEHAYMNEVLAYSPFSARLFGVVAPNSGNQKMLLKYGTEAQKKKWLLPLIEGKLESCFSMTEPDVAGSDPRAIQTTARLEGEHWVINGRKWFTSNAKRADIAIVVARTEGEGGSGRMTQFIVPTNSPGFNLVRSVPVWGHTHGDHGEIIYDNVRVPLDHQLGHRGSGHQAAQDRLGAGRVFHCMNSIGSMWRAFDLMCHHVNKREVHGGLLAEKQFTQGAVADNYNDIQAARLMTLDCAQRMENDQDPRVAISSIKIFVPQAFGRVVDRAIQLFGAKGVSGDLPLAGMFTGARTLRLADGPDEVHKILIARSILKHYTKGGPGWDFAN